MAENGIGVLVVHRCEFVLGFHKGSVCYDARIAEILHGMEEGVFES